MNREFSFFGGTRMTISAKWLCGAASLLLVLGLSMGAVADECKGKVEKASWCDHCKKTVEKKECCGKACTEVDVCVPEKGEKSVITYKCEGCGATAHTEKGVNCAEGCKGKKIAKDCGHHKKEEKKD